MQLEQSDALSLRDPTDMTFDPLRPINPTKLVVFHAFMEDPTKERHDAIYPSFTKIDFQNILNSRGWWYDTVSDSTKLFCLF